MRTGTPKAGGLGGLFHANTPERRASSNDWPNSLNHVGSFGARGVVEVWKHREEERPQVPQSRRDEQGRQVAGPSEGRARSQDRCKARGAPVAHLSLCPQSIDHFLSLSLSQVQRKRAHKDHQLQKTARNRLTQSTINSFRLNHHVHLKETLAHCLWSM